MAGSYPVQSNPGAFVPTTNIWDVTELYSANLKDPKELLELLVRLYQNLNNISLRLNISDAGYYTRVEFLNGQTFFPNPALSSTTTQAPTQRQVFRYVVDFGALPNAGTKSVVTTILLTNTFSFTRIYGAASDPVNFSYIPIPYASTTAVANNIELFVDSVVVGPDRFARVNIRTAANYSAYTITYVVLEYIKQ